MRNSDIGLKYFGGRILSTSPLRTLNFTAHPYVVNQYYGVTKCD